jgi:DNA invertase Pin-like site-specific DNA recombinase
MKKKEKRKMFAVTLDRRRVRTYLLHVSKAIESPGRPRAIGYVRVSSRAQATDGGSLEAQREAIVRHAVLSGLDLVRIETDGGISGGKSEDKRPGLAAVLEAIRSGAASVVIVRHVDRLSRDSSLAGYLRVQVKRAGGRIEIIEEAKNDPIRQAVDTMLAELEKIRGSERMRSFHAARKAKGLGSGPAPFGMRIGPNGRLQPDPAVAGTVERILALRDQGASLRVIARHLNADHVAGRRWNPMTVSGVLRRQGGQP